MSALRVIPYFVSGYQTILYMSALLILVCKSRLQVLVSDVSRCKLYFPSGKLIGARKYLLSHSHNVNNWYYIKCEKWFKFLKTWWYLYMSSLMFLAISIPTVFITLAALLYIVNSYADRLQAWGERHLK